MRCSQSLGVLLNRFNALIQCLQLILRPVDFSPSFEDFEGFLLIFSCHNLYTNMMFGIRRLFCLAKIKGQGAIAKVEVSFSPEKKMQFFVPVTWPVEKFTETVQKKCVEPITFEIENNYKGTESFIDTTILNNLTLKMGKKILAFEIKEYEQTYDYMPKYNADLLEEFQKQVPVGVKVKDIKNIDLNPFKSHKDYYPILKADKEKFLTWYNTEMDRIAKECLRTPRIMITAMAVQWVFLFVITFGVYGWDTGEPLSYLSGLTVDLALFLGYLGMEERYVKRFDQARADFFKDKITDVEAYFRHLHWRTMYIKKKMDSLR